MSAQHLETPRVRGHRGRFWEAAKLRGDGDGERRVGWLELFYDLVFVVVISRLTHHFSENLSLGGALEFVATFIPVWWVWIGGMYYAERFETRDFSFRLFTFLQMLPVAGMALNVEYAFDGRWVGFALSYIAARLIIIFLWWRGARHDPSFAPTAVRFNTGFVVSVMLWSISLFTPLGVSIWLAALGLLSDLVTPWTTIQQQSALPRLSKSHLPERFGLFVIIVLGEAMIGVIGGVEKSKPIDTTVLLEGALGMTLVFAIWWLYFDFVARRVPNPGFRSTLPWSYLHLPLVMGITASSAAILNVITAKASIGGGAHWVMAGALALILVVVGLLEYTLQREAGEPTHEHGSSLLKFAGAGLALLIGAFAGGLNAVFYTLLLLTPLLMQIVYGVWVWFNRYPDVSAQPALENEPAQT